MTSDERASQLASEFLGVEFSHSPATDTWTATLANGEILHAVRWQELVATLRTRERLYDLAGTPQIVREALKHGATRKR